MYPARLTIVTINTPSLSKLLQHLHTSYPHLTSNPIQFLSMIFSETSITTRAFALIAATINAAAVIQKRDNSFWYSSTKATTRPATSSKFRLPQWG